MARSSTSSLTSEPYSQRFRQKKWLTSVRRETGDEAFVELFAKALEVHTGNEDELVGYTHLFPKGGIGVAQGSSLVLLLE
jgi:hypothetical protein